MYKDITEFLRLHDVSFSYTDDSSEKIEVIKSVSLTINKGEYVVITGANGSGKSTLVRIMCGFLQPQSGSVNGYAFRGELFTVPRNADVDYSVPSGLVFQDPKDQIISSIVRRDTAFGPENLHISPVEVERRTEEVLNLTILQDIATQKTVTLSSGQKQRLALAGICALYPQMLVLDEALSMIDPVGRERIISFLKIWHSKGGTVVHITHDESVVEQANRLLFMEHGSLVYDGTPVAFIKQNSFFSEMSVLNKTFVMQKENSKSSNQNTECSLYLKDIQFHYPESPLLFSHFSIAFIRGSITAITGVSGAGKTTLFELASGLLSLDRGVVYAEKKPVLAQQDCANALFEEFAADDVAYGPRRQGLKGSALKQCVSSAMNSAGVPFADFADKRIVTLSGGQRRKVSIAGILALDSPILLFDEPTAGLDPQSRNALFALFSELRNAGKTIVFTTHQYWEAAVADRHVVLGKRKEGNECSILYDTSGIVPNEDTLSLMETLSDAKMLNFFLKASEGYYVMCDSPVHRLNCLSKYLVLFFFVASGICLMNIPFLCLDCLLCLVYAYQAQYPFKKLWSNFLKILPWIALFFIFQMLFFPVRTGDILFWSVGPVSITLFKINLGIRTMLHYVAILIPISVFLWSTEETEIIDGLKALLKPLDKLHLPTRHIVLGISIIFRFLPLLMEECASIIKTQLIRSGGSLHSGSAKKGIFSRVRTMIPIFVPLIIRTLKRAELLAQALVARYYN